MKQNTLSKLMRRHEFNLFCAFVVLFGIFAVAQPRFRTMSNFLSILNQNSIVFVIAVGFTVILILAGMDLSAGYNAVFAGVLATGFMSGGMNMYAAMLLAVLIATGIGLINGLIITRLNIVDFIVTLGSMSIVHGAIFSYTNGYSIYENIPADFLIIGQHKLGGVIPVTLLFCVVVFAIGSIMLNKTRIGTYIYATGCNSESSRLSGINVKFVKCFGYAFSGCMCGVAGIMAMSRLGSGQPTAGETFLFDAVGAAVLGGTNMNGGEGTILGTMLGVLVIGVITNGLTMMGTTYYDQEMVKGLIIILAVAYNAYRARQKAK